jgi:triosephosphate isomerase
MVKHWVRYVIVGHSERREYFGETHQQVANKVERCVENSLTPIVCVDEPYAERQIAAIQEEYLTQCVFGYEPLEAIGTGTPDKPEHAQKVIGKIREKLPEGVPVIYGGSVTSVNVAEYVNDTVSDGALVGGASLDAEGWKAMVMEIT